MKHTIIQSHGVQDVISLVVMAVQDICSKEGMQTRGCLLLHRELAVSQLLGMLTVHAT